MAKHGSIYQPIFKLNSVDEREASTSRKVHLRQLNDALHLSLERGDLPHARRAWAILARCKEFDWENKWQTSLLLLSNPSSSSHFQQDTGRSIELLKKLMRYYPVEQESILQEIILHLADSGKFREALDELDLYLPSFPYQENPVLHSYAGLLSLKLATSVSSDDKLRPIPDARTLSEAKTHFDRALSIDPDNLVAKAFSEEVNKQIARSNATASHAPEDVPSDEEMDLDNTDPATRGKRFRRAASEE